MSWTKTWAVRVLVCSAMGILGIACADKHVTEPNPQCENADERLCGDTCVDIQSHDAHCGACDHACNAGQRCNEGECVSETPPDDLCDPACATNQHCEDGVCVENDPPTDTCEDDLVDCNEADEPCIDLQSDPRHCGACDNPCDEMGMGMQRCYQGACVPLCPRGYGTCGAGCCPPTQYCADETAEPENACGQFNCLIGSPCGHGCCQEDEYCRAADVCAKFCEPDQTFCGENRCCNTDTHVCNQETKTCEAK